MSERILLIIESPNKVKTIKPYLPSNYVVMASFGHISEIKDGGGYWNTGIDPKNNFKANFAVTNDKDNKDRVATLKEQVKVADRVILATDPDREGEAISWSLKKFLSIPDKKYERVTFHEITKSAVLKALEHPEKINDNLVDSAQTRQIEDKMLGYRLSPVVRKLLGAKSLGRCQGAGLILICERDEEVRNFVSETFYELWLHFVKNGTEFKAKYIGTNTNKADKFSDTSEISKIIDECEPPFIITNVQKKIKKEYPKPPFTTSTFGQEVYNKLGIRVGNATDIAQRLFEGVDVGGQHIALITYIRTDSSEIAPEFIPLLEEHVKSTYGDNYYAPIRKGKKQANAQEGHEAIRCVDLSMTPEKLATILNDKSLLKVYDIIYKRTVAAMMQPRLIEETTYTINCHGHLFEFTSRAEKFDGYRRAYKYEDEEDSKEENNRETFSINESLNVKSLDTEERETKPKQRYTDATYVKALEDTGIGRPSTYASNLQTVTSKSRGYCEIVDGYIVPTQKGLELYHFIVDNLSDLISVKYTSEMEKELDEIRQGEKNKLDVLNEFYNKLEDTVKKAFPERGSKEPTNEVCPLCGAQMVVRTGQYGRFLGCSKYPKCKGIKKIV